MNKLCRTFVVDRELTEHELEAIKRAWDNSPRPHSIIVVPYQPPPTPLKFWELVAGIDT